MRDTRWSMVGIICFSVSDANLVSKIKLQNPYYIFDYEAYANEGQTWGLAVTPWRMWSSCAGVGLVSTLHKVLSDYCAFEIFR